MLFLFSNYNISPLALSRCVLVVTIILLTSLWRIYGVLERGGTLYEFHRFFMLRCYLNISLCNIN